MLDIILGNNKCYRFTMQPNIPAIRLLKRVMRYYQDYGKYTLFGYLLGDTSDVSDCPAIYAHDLTDVILPFLPVVDTTFKPVRMYLIEYYAIQTRVRRPMRAPLSWHLTPWDSSLSSLTHENEVNVPDIRSCARWYYGTADSGYIIRICEIATNVRYSAEAAKLKRYSNTLSAWREYIRKQQLTN
jgi:hypothetical protein